jgi:hypothetical protein
MTTTWILIVALQTSSGKFVKKLEFGPYETKNACLSNKVPETHRWKSFKLCVSKAHWEGLDVDPGVVPD